MAKSAALRGALLDQTIALAAERGLDNLSLRTIASRSGCSTAVIFQQFHSKSGLIAEALDHACRLDEQFHKRLKSEVDGLLGDHLAFADFLAFYIEARVQQDVSRFWSEVFFKAKRIEGAKEHLCRWHAMRTEFWRDVLTGVDCHRALPSVISSYAIMEETYAHALVDQAQYRLLLRETTRSLTAAAFGIDIRSVREIPLCESLATAPLSSDSLPDQGSPVREQLLDHAVSAIVETGIGAVSQRELTRKARVSSSTIAYHFGNMRAFVSEAIWRSLVHGIPADLDPGRDYSGMPESMDAWFVTIDDHVRPAADGLPAGFYTGFARITGQTCLLAKAQPRIAELVRYLRALEGWGTFRVRRHIHPEDDCFARDHAAAFGMWIKAEAMLREAGMVEAVRDADRVRAAARLIFP